MNGEVPRILQCRDGDVEAKRVVSSIQQRLRESKRRPRDFAILFRTNEQPRLFEMELREAKIPYVIFGGQSFFDRKEVKDIVSYLKFVDRSNDDIALLRIINSPPRGIGSTTLQKIRNYSSEKKISMWNAISPNSDLLPTLEPRSQTALSSFYNTILSIKTQMRNSFSVNSVEELLDKVRYNDEILRLYPDEKEQTERKGYVDEVISAVASYLNEHPGGSLGDLLDDASLGGPDF